MKIMKIYSGAPDVIRVKNGKLIAPVKYIKDWARENNISEETPVCVIDSDSYQKLIEQAERAVLRCHFCCKSSKEVFCIIQGFDVFICDECVAVCVDIVNEKRGENE